MRKALYILADLEDQDLLWFANVGTYQIIRSGTELITAGSLVDTLFIVVDGELNVVLPSGKMVASIGTGDIIGEMSLIEKRAPTVSVITSTDSKLLAIPHAVISEQLEQDAGFAARFYHALAVFLADRLRSTVSQLGYGDVKLEDNQETFERDHELDESLLDNVHVAGDRMLRLINLLEGRQP